MLVKLWDLELTTGWCIERSCIEEVVDIEVFFGTLRDVLQTCLERNQDLTDGSAWGLATEEVTNIVSDGE